MRASILKDSCWRPFYAWSKLHTMWAPSWWYWGKMSSLSRWPLIYFDCVRWPILIDSPFLCACLAQLWSELTSSEPWLVHGGEPHGEWLGCCQGMLIWHVWAVSSFKMGVVEDLLVVQLKEYIQWFHWLFSFFFFEYSLAKLSTN